MTLSKIIELPQLDDYLSFFLNSTPLLDVRAPIEFNQGAFPCTTNVPLMNDHERTVIGIRYKERGQDEAIKLGHELVQGSIKSERVEQWSKFVKQHPQGVLYCFRGGMRSKISQQWIYEQTGIIFPRIKGGYKAMRRFLINELEISSQLMLPIVLSGRTGIGKTLLLNTIKPKIDLEGIFHHRGSVFGKHVTPQPSQIDIENTLSIALLKLRHQGHIQIIMEDESCNIGSRKLPECLFEKMKQSPIVLLEAPIEERIDIIFQEYILEALSEHQAFYGEEKGFQCWTEQLQEALDNIQRRLGGVRHKQLKLLLINAIQQHKSGKAEAHKEWIKILLVDYYDPMYDYQLSKKQERVIFKGMQNEVHNYLTNKLSEHNKL